jgi:hypothetical protein
MKQSFFLLFFVCLSIHLSHYSVTLLIIPAYGPQIVHGDFERDIATNWAHALKYQLSSKTGSHEIIILEQAGQELDQITTINTVNKINPDLVISLNLFPTIGVPQLFLYQVASAKNSALTSKKNDALEFLPYKEAHIRSSLKSKALGEKMIHLLKKNPTDTYDIRDIYAVPYQPLIGLLPPALGIELGVVHPKNWELVMPQLVDAVSLALNQLP